MSGYYGTLEECREYKEEGCEVLLESAIHNTESGEVSTYHTLVKKDDKYNIFVYFQAGSDGKWIGACKMGEHNIDKNIDELLIDLCKTFFSAERKRIVKNNVKIIEDKE